MSNVDEIEPLVPQRVENAIKKRLNQRAAESCKPLIEAYVNCSRDRTLSIVWACKNEIEEWRKCNAIFTNYDNVIMYKREYVLLQKEREAAKAAKAANAAASTK